MLRSRWIYGLSASMLAAATAALALAAAPPARAALSRAPSYAATSHPDTSYADAVHLLSRATFGVRPQDVTGLLAMGRDAWLDRQLHPERIPDDSLRSRLQRDFPAAEMSIAQLVQAYPLPDAASRAAAARRRAQADSMRAVDAGSAAATSAMSMSDSMNVEVRRRQSRAAGQAPNPAVQMVVQLVGARLERDVASPRQLQEVMTDFWFNHFNVFLGKGPDRWLVADFENHAIRPHVFGHFEDMLVATAEHPAMLFFLDNARSTAPDSAPVLAPPGRFGRRARTGQTGGTRPGATRTRGTQARRTEERGINENYARELMELHTLGVDGGYTQQDVIQVARAFTGWSIVPPRAAQRLDALGRRDIQPFQFIFRPAVHDAGAKVILGHHFPAGRGMQDGLEVLHLLASSPATAHHLSYELAQWFVADDPPASLVNRLTHTWISTHGDLREVTRVLFTSPEFYDRDTFGAKVKTPYQFIVSALRSTDADIKRPRGLAAALRKLGQLPYMQSSPAGYPLVNAGWVSGGELVGRMNVALALAVDRVPGVRLPSDLFNLEPQALVHRLMPGDSTANVMSAIATSEQDSKLPLSPAQRAVAIALGSPQFQRR